MAICEFPSGRFIDVNQVFLDYSDFGRNEVIGRSAMELGLFGDPSFEEWMIATVKKGEKIRNVEMECVPKKWGTDEQTLLRRYLHRRKIFFSLLCTRYHGSQTERKGTSVTGCNPPGNRDISGKLIGPGTSTG